MDGVDRACAGSEFMGEKKRPRVGRENILGRGNSEERGKKGSWQEKGH